MADAKQASTTEQDFEEERPLFSYTYELSNSLVDEAASALAGDRMKNPASVASAFLLVAIVMLAASPIGTRITPLLMALVVLNVVLWNLSAKWHAIQVRRLRKAGLDTALVPEGKRRRTVSLYEDRVVIEAHNGDKTTYPTSTMHKPKLAGDMLVLVFSGGHFVPVPRRALSASRFNDLLRHVAARTGAKLAE